VLIAPADVSGAPLPTSERSEREVIDGEKRRERKKKKEEGGGGEKKYYLLKALSPRLRAR